MPRLRSRWFMLAALLPGALVAAWVARGAGGRDAGELPADDWDIPRLVAHLKEKGVDLRMVSTQKDGPFDSTAFLTTTGATWQDLNGLSKDPRRLERWRGTLYCERACPRPEAAALYHLWGDSFFVAGPFIFFGDPRLLEQVRSAFCPP